MKIVADANVLLAVVLGEPERDWAIRVTREGTAFAPKSLPFEIGNALTSLVKRKRLSPDGMIAAWTAASSYQVALVEIDMNSALRLAAAQNVYAYDAYVLQCALERRARLLTLDRRMVSVGRAIGLDVLEP